MNFEPLEEIANAVLYEGFLLYPYRRSSVKNQQRWQFGTLGPVNGTDRTMMQTECLVEGSVQTEVDVKIRFLQGETERELLLRELSLTSLPSRSLFSFPPIYGAVELESIPVNDNAFRLTARILNLSEQGEQESSMMSTHTLLGVQEGNFISLMDPPEEYRSAAAACKNVGTWPVLAGREGERSLMLSSPIILYDYPQISPESPGDLFDGTEIDEILSLRLLTLSDEEKRELLAAGDRGQAILERTEALPPAAFAKMHGAIRGLRIASKLEFREGDRVRLRPKKRADIFDIALDGQIAIIDAVERDFEDNIHLAVTIENDPGRDLGAAKQIGHRFFFGVEEVELV